MVMETKFSLRVGKGRYLGSLILVQRGCEGSTSNSVYLGKEVSFKEVCELPVRAFIFKDNFENVYTKSVSKGLRGYPVEIIRKYYPYPDSIFKDTEPIKKDFLSLSEESFIYTYLPYYASMLGMGSLVVEDSSLVSQLALIGDGLVAKDVSYHCLGDRSLYSSYRSNKRMSEALVKLGFKEFTGVTGKLAHKAGTLFEVLYCLAEEKGYPNIKKRLLKALVGNKRILNIIKDVRTIKESHYEAT